MRVTLPWRRSWVAITSGPSNEPTIHDKVPPARAEAGRQPGPAPGRGVEQRGDVPRPVLPRPRAPPSCARPSSAPGSWTRIIAADGAVRGRDTDTRVGSPNGATAGAAREVRRAGAH